MKQVRLSINATNPSLWKMVDYNGYTEDQPHSSNQNREDYKFENNESLGIHNISSDQLIQFENIKLVAGMIVYFCNMQFESEFP